MFKGTVRFILGNQEFDLDVDTQICVPAGVKYSIMNLYQGLARLYYHLSVSALINCACMCMCVCAALCAVAACSKMVTVTRLSALSSRCTVTVF